MYTEHEFDIFFSSHHVHVFILCIIIYCMSINICHDICIVSVYIIHVYIVYKFPGAESSVEMAATDEPSDLDGLNGEGI